MIARDMVLEWSHGNRGQLTAARRLTDYEPEKQIAILERATNKSN